MEPDVEILSQKADFVAAAKIYCRVEKQGWADVVLNLDVDRVHIERVGWDTFETDWCPNDVLLIKKLKLISITFNGWYCACGVPSSRVVSFVCC